MKNKPPKDQREIGWQAELFHLKVGGDMPLRNFG
jgi:hypothetical protein